MISACGINCEICDQFRDNQCFGCLKDEKCKTCEAYLCAAEKIGDLAVRRKIQPKVSTGWAETYSWYMELMRKKGSYSLVNTIGDASASLELIFGKRKAHEALQRVLAQYIETEKEMSREDLRRMISEVAFVFLVDVIPLVDAVNWADELLVKHKLK